jgi:putative colanic acid biosynthesis acetyltransferase WcaF
LRVKNKYQNIHLPISNKILRLLWAFISFFLFKPTPRIFHFWRRLILVSFGAKLGKSVHIYPSAKIWAPWNLEMGDFSCLADNVDCYCVDKIKIGTNTIISQYTFLCTASHDYKYTSMPLITSPIVIGDNVWIAADVFIAPGIKISNGSVIKARSSLISNVPSYSIFSGNPATFVKKREFINDK